jgi:hypothetical protein
MSAYTVLAMESNQIDCIQELGKDYVYMTYRLERRTPFLLSIQRLRDNGMRSKLLNGTGVQLS